MIVAGTSSSTTIIRSCSPSGWDSDSEDCLGFSQTVCPSGWNYNAIARVTHSSTVATTAFCCPSGYQLKSLHRDPQLANSIFSNQCERWVKGAEDDRSATATASPSDSTLIVHQAWAITWDASDRATLSTKPPASNSRQTIQTWGAPQPVTNQALLARENPVNDGPFQEPWISLLTIGLPVIFGSLFICLFCMCYWNRRKMRKRGQEVRLDSLPAPATPGNPSANFR